MGTRAETLKKQVSTHAKIGDEATAALLEAEDALAGVEDRESRRASRSRVADPRRD